MRTFFRLPAVAVLALACAAPAAGAGDKILHLAIGDPAR